jgi:hypothetical protein
VKPFPKSTLAMAACIPEEVLSSAMEVINFVAQHAGHVFGLLTFARCLATCCTIVSCRLLRSHTGVDRVTW